jgi:predicted MPP superfamily phosphohydrolase
MLNRPFKKLNLDDIDDRHKNKLYEEKYLITSPYFTYNDKRIAVFSDIHYQSSISKQIFLLIDKYIELTNPDFAVFPGDLLENDNYLENERDRTFLINLISSIAEKCPVIIIPGNHDIHNLNIRSYFFNNSPSTDKVIKFLESLNKINNVYFLNNEQVNIDGLTFTGFCPSYKTFLLGLKQEARDIFMEEYIKSGLSMKEDDFNILLSHNPIPFTIGEEYKQIDDFNNKTDLIISGHLHGGYLPKFMYYILNNTNVGMFIYPLAFPIPGIACRGVHDVGRGKLFISKCYRKFTTDIPLFNFLERYTANDVEELTLTNTEKQMVLSKK